MQPPGVSKSWRPCGISGSFFAFMDPSYQTESSISRFYVILYRALLDVSIYCRAAGSTAACPRSIQHTCHNVKLKCTASGAGLHGQTSVVELCKSQVPSFKETVKSTLMFFQRCCKRCFETAKNRPGVFSPGAFFRRPLAFP